MSDNNDLIKLYSKQILGLAADIHHTGRLNAPQASARVRAPLCGSSISVDVVMIDGKITEFAQNVRACALGQASASVLGKVVIGLDLATLTAARAALENMLKQNGPTPLPPFDGLDVLRAAREFKNRHASILLALDATIEAVSKAEEAQAC